MSFDERLADRCRSLLQNEGGISEKKMFGGLSFLLDGKMVCGVLGKRLVVRIDPSDCERMLGQPFVSPMDFTGRPMAGFIYVASAGLASFESLDRWIRIGLKEGMRRNKGVSKPRKRSASVLKRRVHGA